MELKLQVEDLRRRLDGQERAPARMIELTPRPEIGEISVTPIDEPEPDEIVYRPGMTMAEVEKAAIAAALKDFRGNRRRAAEQLGIGERTLYRKIRAYNLDS
jgi:transcriptional regulator of acetoin/glycerol metabolism